ncbi:hypothetical protein CU097_004857 [Rhizopus azygosporus]|uniref:Arrestin C-terminal-like domain-containing protein n=1 Tax=Rhizopus azygosporus TaxID=86630 RepID=A0A367KBV5_RHIAZ|nr:hypothetical protein CU097_004857 [Rhizopus azygosporus]
MKEGFQSIKIGPFTDHLEFIGLIKSSNPAAGSSLRGTLELSVQKTIKVKSMSLKFKGKSQATYTRPNDLQKFTITAKILPKLKTKIVEKSLTLHHGHHTFPWELDIPNVYPQTYSSDRCDISYYLELKIYLGVGRSVTVQHPITIHRHLVASPQSAALMNTKLYQYTSPDKFHYQIEAPKVICLDQEYFPLSIKYTCFNGSLLSHIRTFIVQTEVHRMRNLTKIEIERKSTADQPSLSKAITHLDPAMINYISTQSDNINDHSLLLKQKVPKIGIICGTESPLVAIYHQLDITFDLGNDKVQTRIPIYVSSLPTTYTKSVLDENFASVKYEMESRPHQKPMSTDILNSPIPEDRPQKRGTRFSIRRSLSDQMLGGKIASDKQKPNFLDPSQSSSSTTTSSSPSPPPPPPKTAGSTKILTPIDTGLANQLESIRLAGSDDVNSSAQAYYMGSPLLSQGAMSPSMEPNSGLFPPPRRPRKKTVTIDDSTRSLTSRIPGTNHTFTVDIMKKIPEDVPSIPLPTPPTSGRLSDLSQPHLIAATPYNVSSPTSPRAPLPKPHQNHLDPTADRIIRSSALSRSSSDNSSLSRRSSTSSCSSCSSSGLRLGHLKPTPYRQSDATSGSSNSRKYSESVNHYVSAELPPLPSFSLPNSTDLLRQHMTSIPSDYIDLSDDEEFDILVYRDLVDDDGLSLTM